MADSSFGSENFMNDQIAPQPASAAAASVGPCWMLGEDGSVPSGAVVACQGVLWMEYVARVHHQGYILPAILLPNVRHSLTFYNGTPLRKQSYEVLCNADMRWVAFDNTAAIPEDALPIGYSKEDGALYLGRTCINGTPFLGMVSARTRECKFFFEDQENPSSKKFELLQAPQHVREALEEQEIHRGMLDLFYSEKFIHEKVAARRGFSEALQDLPVPEQDQILTLAQFQQAGIHSGVSLHNLLKRVITHRSSTDRGAEDGKNSSMIARILREKGLGWLKFRGDVTSVPGNAVVYHFTQRREPFFLGRVAEPMSKTSYGLVGNKFPHDCVVPCDSGTFYTFFNYEVLIKLRPQVPLLGPVPTPEERDEGLRLFELPMDDVDYVRVSEQMQSSILSHPDTHGATLTRFNITKIERVQHPKLTRLFQDACEWVEGETGVGQANKVELFYGSHNCEQILQNGFEYMRRLTTNSGKFGKGIYLTEHSSKSDQFALVGPHGMCASHGSGSCASCPRQMLHCRVVLGKVSENTAPDRRRAHAPPGHHSVKGVSAPGPRALKYPKYIVYRGEQVLPQFLITYTIQ